MAGGVFFVDDLIVDILAKLPVKSLLRFTCVCKPWYSVISDPKFTRSLHRMRRPSLWIREEIPSIPIESISSIPIESLLLLEKKRNHEVLTLPWEVPFNFDGCSSTNLILGSSDGLVCVFHETSRGHIRERSGLFLWNPSTRKFKLLPCPGCYGHSIQEYSYTFAWFGYDESIHDYKFVILNCTGFECPPIMPELHVFTLKSNTWKRCPIDHLALCRIREFCGRLYLQSESLGVLCNGAVHWVDGNRCLARVAESEDCILAFDLASENFRLIKFSHPPFLKIFLWVGSILGGCLCLCYLNEECGRPVANLWVMKQYGVESRLGQKWHPFLDMKLELLIRDVASFIRFYSQMKIRRL